MKRTIFFLLLVAIISSCKEQLPERKIISSPNAPKAIGPYSQAVQVGDFLYLSGQLGMDPETGKLSEDFEDQSRQALENIKSILTEAEYSFKNVAQCQVFLKDMNNYAVFNSIYKEYFTDNFPARAVLEVSRIPADGLVEIMMVAVKTK